MSAVQVTYRFSDGDSLCIAVEADSSYADALDEARAVALRLYREAARGHGGDADGRG